MKNLYQVLWPVMLWSFVVIKGWGVAFAAWSWWWLLLPIVPELWLALGKAGLLA